MHFKEFINELAKIDLSKISFDRLMSALTNNSYEIPLTTTLVKKGTIIERGRITEKDEYFTSEKDISFRTDIENIKKFGRANLPFNSMFYGSIATKEIKEARVAVFAELCPEFRQEPVQDVDISITIGQWEVTDEFEVADIVFSEEYYANTRASRNKEHWQNYISENPKVNLEEHKAWLKFFSKQFSKSNIKSDYEYMYSCFYTYLALHLKKLKGVVYPSVRSDYLIDNIVLPPKVVEENIKLKKVGKFRLFSKNGKGTLEPIAITEDLGFLNTNFNWD